MKTIMSAGCQNCPKKLDSVRVNLHILQVRFESLFSLRSEKFNERAVANYLLAKLKHQ